MPRQTTNDDDESASDLAYRRTPDYDEPAIATRPSTRSRKR